MNPMGEFDVEPWWVVVGDIEGGTYGVTVDAPTEDEARALGQRELIFKGEGDIDEISRITGPFPKSYSGDPHLPRKCNGCGMSKWDGDEEPMGHETMFRKLEDEIYQCIQCLTKVRVARQ